MTRLVWVVTLYCVVFFIFFWSVISSHTQTLSSERWCGSTSTETSTTAEHLSRMTTFKKSFISGLGFGCQYFFLAGVNCDILEILYSGIPYISWDMSFEGVGWDVVQSIKSIEPWFSVSGDDSRTDRVISLLLHTVRSMQLRQLFLFFPGLRDRSV